MFLFSRTSRTIRTFSRSLIKIRHCCTQTMVRYVNQEDAINIDKELFNDYKFSVEQLMELAGLSCAVAITKCYPVEEVNKKFILVLSGPGNNGGDGLVCARHLQHFGYRTHIYYQKKIDKPIFRNLVRQASASEANFLTRLPSAKNAEQDYALIVDALFGFSFVPPVRPDFAPIMEFMTEAEVPIASIDVPSGWDVVNGRMDDEGISPELLISLTAPKQCAQQFTGKYHYLGGRFVPPALEKKYNLGLPKYPGTECVVALR